MVANRKENSLPFSENIVLDDVLHRSRVETIIYLFDKQNQTTLINRSRICL